MIDYVKIWVRNYHNVNKILGNDAIDFKGQHSIKSGEVYHYPILGNYSVFDVEIKSPTWCEIKGSLHRYWNKGTNENDFTFQSLIESIVNLCNFIKINPFELSIHNMEFGVNIKPEIDATRILKNIICYKNKEAIKQIDSKKYFIEFEMDNYYIKVYDKGLQSKKKWEIDNGNVFRFEVKSMRNSHFRNSGVKTLGDLLNLDHLQVLERKIHNVFQFVVFDDDEIDTTKMNARDRKHYLKWSNPRTWTNYNKNSTIAAQEKRFKDIVSKYGVLRLSEQIGGLIEAKTKELLTIDAATEIELNKVVEHYKKCGNSYLIYTRNNHNITTTRKCLSCGNDISQQQGKSKYCSAKYFGEIHAHRCRNMNSNPRNNFNRQLAKINERGQFLFDINPYLRIA